MIDSHVTQSERMRDRQPTYSPGYPVPTRSYPTRPGLSMRFKPLTWFSVLTIGVVGLALLQLRQDLLRGFGSLVPTLAPPRLTPGTVVLQLRNAADLTTAIYTGEVIVPISQDQVWASFVIGSTKLLYVAKGEVKAGIDLNRLTTNDVIVGTDSIRVTLPAPVILDSKIDVNQSQIYDHQRSLFGPDVAVDLHQRAQREALRRIEAAACEGGLLQLASDRAQLVITRLLQQMGYPQVDVQSAPVNSAVASPAGNAMANQFVNQQCGLRRS